MIRNLTAEAILVVGIGLCILLAVPLLLIWWLAYIGWLMPIVLALVILGIDRRRRKKLSTGYPHKSTGS